MDLQKHVFSTFIDAGAEKTVNNEPKFVPKFTSHTVKVQNKTTGTQKTVNKLQQQKSGKIYNHIKKDVKVFAKAFPRCVDLAQKKQVEAARPSSEKVLDQKLKLEQTIPKFSVNSNKNLSLSLSKSRKRIANNKKPHSCSINVPVKLNSFSSEKLCQEPKENIYSNRLTEESGRNTNSSNRSYTISESHDGTISAAEKSRQTAAYALAKEIIEQADLSRNNLTERIENNDKNPSIDCTKSGVGFVQSELQLRVDNDQDFAESVSKKPRSKATVQESLNVAELARKNELKKANSATLRFWLNQKGVKARSNTKKDELIQKVQEALVMMQQS